MAETSWVMAQEDATKSCCTPTKPAEVSTSPPHTLTLTASSSVRHANRPVAAT